MPNDPRSGVDPAAGDAARTRAELPRKRRFAPVDRGADVPGFSLPRTARIRSQRDFRRVYGRGVRAHGKLLVLVALGAKSPGHRLGLAVSKEHGNAVRRNKLKRILREAFRLERPTLAGAFDLVVIPRVRDGHLELADARRELVDLVTRLAANPPRGARPGARGAGRRRSGDGKRAGNDQGSAERERGSAP